MSLKRLARAALARKTRNTLVFLLVLNVLSVVHYGITHVEVGPRKPRTQSHQPSPKAGSLAAAIARSKRHKDQRQQQNRNSWHDSAALAYRLNRKKPTMQMKPPSTPWPTMAPDPRSPLNAERLTIVKRSPVVNLTYESPVNISRHPHIGAPWYNTSLLRLQAQQRERQGQTQHPTAPTIPNLNNGNSTSGNVTNTSRPFLEVKEYTLDLDLNTRINLSEACNRHDADFVALKRIRVATLDMIRNASASIAMTLNQTEIKSNSLSQQQRRPIRLLCVIYSSEPFHARVQAIRETWGPKCDGFFVASNVTDANFNAVGIPHLDAESYGNMWNKVRSVWSYIYQNYFDDFDYVHLAGEDAWILVENLRYYLNSEELAIAANGGYYLPDLNTAPTTQVPLYLGRRLALEKNHSDTFNTGGPGYTLNRAAIKLLVTQGLDLFNNSQITSAEDVKVASTFLRLGVHPYPTRELDTKSERYHHLNPGLHYFSGHLKRPHSWVDWWSLAFNQTKGGNHSSVYSAAFHYMVPDDMRRYHALVYGYCLPYINNKSATNSTEHEGSLIEVPSLLMLGTHKALQHSEKVQDAMAEYKVEIAKKRNKTRAKQLHNGVLKPKSGVEQSLINFSNIRRAEHAKQQALSREQQLLQQEKAEEPSNLKRRPRLFNWGYR